MKLVFVVLVFFIFCFDFEVVEMEEIVSCFGVYVSFGDLNLILNDMVNKILVGEMDVFVDLFVVFVFLFECWLDFISVVWFCVVDL